jgi:alkylhydroperoxidase family enzyme
MTDENGGPEPRPDDSGAAVLERFRGKSASGELDRNPQLSAFFECWLDTFLFKGTVDPRLRELTILRVMWRCAQSFEWANHYRLARRLGVSDEEILAVRATDPDAALAAEAALVVRAADEMLDLGRLTPATYAAAQALFPEPGVVQEFLYLVGGYRMFAFVSATTGTSAADHDLPLWPPDGVGPADAEV